MRNVKWVIVSLVICCCLLIGIGVYLFSPANNLKAFGQQAPRVVILADPANMPEHIRATLPTGYERDPGGLEQFDMTVETANPDDPNAVFMIQEGFTNVADQMRSGRELGKETVYFFFYEPDPNEEMVQL